MKPHSEEVGRKIAMLREVMQAAGATGVRLRGTDWFAWATGGGSSTVLLAAETGIAEVLVTEHGAWVLTDAIEEARMHDEELTHNFNVHVNSWIDQGQRDAFVREMAGEGTVLSDRPREGEQALPESLLPLRWRLGPEELERYREVGRLAAEAMTEVLQQARPDWTEQRLAGEGAKALWTRGLHPALTMAAGQARLQRYRHPMQRDEALGHEAMLVFCARGHGLYANLTRFVHFGPMPEALLRRHADIRAIEAAALQDLPGRTLAEVYATLANAYQSHGYDTAIREHHQGGLTGYLAREVVATPARGDRLEVGMAVAWNPSVPGAKVEDTFVIGAEGQLENLTWDPQWPAVAEEAGRPRALPLVRGVEGEP